MQTYEIDLLPPISGDPFGCQCCWPPCHDGSRCGDGALWRVTVLCGCNAGAGCALGDLCDECLAGVRQWTADGDGGFDVVAHAIG